MTLIPTLKRIKIGTVGEAILATVGAVGIVTTFALFPGVALIVAPF